MDYTKPEMEIVQVECADVVTLSIGTPGTDPGIDVPEK